MTQQANPLTALRADLARCEKQIAAVMPPNMQHPAERIVANVVAAARSNIALASCTRTSVIACVLAAVSIGLEVGAGPLNQAYLVPFGSTCTLIVGYRGWQMLLNRAGISIRADVVYSGDRFVYRTGMAQMLEHEPSPSAKRTDQEVVAAYAVLTWRDSGYQQATVLWRDQIEASRLRSKKANSGPWKDHYQAMARVAAVRVAARQNCPVDLHQQLTDAVRVSTWTPQQELRDVLPPHVHDVITSAPESGGLGMVIESTAEEQQPHSSDDIDPSDFDTEGASYGR